MYIFLVESLIRVMYWVVAAILNWPFKPLNINFIALIHPIQWTIALPVGATGPAKRQKKSFCIKYRQDRSQSVHSPGVASCILPV